MRDIIKKADILIEALPYIKKFKGKFIVIKYGGSIMDKADSLDGILLDIIFMNYVGLKPILVHGGGPAINKSLKQKNKDIKFIRGFRVTDEETMRIVCDVLSKLNSQVVRRVKYLGGEAAGILSAKTGAIKACPHKESCDLGFVGEVKSIDLTPIYEIYKDKENIIPIMSPVGIGENGKPYNINADEVASHVAIALKAEKLAVLTDVRGILRSIDDEDSLIATLRVKDVNDLAKRGIIEKGMLPKVAACIKAVMNGVAKTHIIDARIPHALLLEIFTDKGIGTEIIT